MKKSFVFFCILTVLFVKTVSSQQLGELYTERNFSISMPLGWQTVNNNQQYLMIMGPEINGFTPNISFATESHSGSISDYTNDILNMYPQFFSGFTLINRSSFTTDAELTGESITFLGTFNNIRVRQKLYVFPNRRRTTVMIITCTAPASGGERYDSIFDASVKTFNWTR
jgi:hypothetical protein